MKIAFSTLACPDWTLEQAADAAHRYGYQGLELRLLDGAIVTPALDAHERGRIRRCLADAGLHLCCLDTSVKVGDPATSMDEAVAFLHLAAELGSPMIRLFGGAPDGEAWATTAQRAAERLNALAEHGRRVGVQVALETHDSFAAGASLADIFAQVHDHNAGVLWDTLNPFETGETAEQTYAFIGQRLLHMHIKDGGIAPNRTQCTLLGEGRVPVPSILETVIAKGYDGWLSVEWEKKWQPQIAAPEIALPQYAAQLRSYLAALPYAASFRERG